MAPRALALALAIVACTRLSDAAQPKINFPWKFVFGAATSAYQIEGGWNASGKGESIWDRATHQHPELFFDRSNGDVTASSYYHYKDDVKCLRELGVQFYRFSISWTRVLPNGFSNYVNEDGIRYYNDVINELVRYNITPVVTMFHWDLPQSLQDLGGWTNPIMADYFSDYARVLFERFGDRVGAWITFNEPCSFCLEGYGSGVFAPFIRGSGVDDYLCGHTVLRAHGLVYSMYKKDFKEKQQGAIGLSIDTIWYEPETTSPENVQAAEKAIQFNFGWYAHPIFSKHGDYPPVMRRTVDANSVRQNMSRSRLPTFTAEEVAMIQGSADFLGLNHYTTALASAIKGKPGKGPSFEDDVHVRITRKEEWPKSNSTWLKVVPWGFRKVLNWIRKEYQNPPVLVTENGMSLERGLHDRRRVLYLESYMRHMLLAITKDKCNVLGYTYWSLIDNFEWMRGYSERFGLYEVDWTSARRRRTARESATYYASVIRSRQLPPDPGYVLVPRQSFFT